MKNEWSRDFQYYAWRNLTKRGSGRVVDGGFLIEIPISIFSSPCEWMIDRQAPLPPVKTAYFIPNDIVRWKNGKPRKSMLRRITPRIDYFIKPKND